MQVQHCHLLTRAWQDQTGATNGVCKPVIKIAQTISLPMDRFDSNEDPKVALVHSAMTKIPFTELACRCVVSKHYAKQLRFLCLAFWSHGYGIAQHVTHLSLLRPSGWENS